MPLSANAPLLSRAKQAASFALLSSVVTLSACGGADGEPGDSQSAAQTVDADMEIFNLKIACHLEITPECVESGSLGCVEGHDQLYTAYIVDPRGTKPEDHREVVHFDCPQRTEEGQSCATPSQAIPDSYFTVEWKDIELCPNKPKVFTKVVHVADDDGCAIAASHGDTLCWAGQLFTDYKWTDGSEVTFWATCRHRGGCNFGAQASNVGAGKNQVTFKCEEMTAPEGPEEDVKYRKGMWKGDAFGYDQRILGGCR